MTLRADGQLDVLVIGGGPLGCAVARDATGRGLTVALAESGDLGGDLAAQIVLGATRDPLDTDAQEAVYLARICPQLVLPADPAPRRWFARRRVALPAVPISAARFAVLCARDAHERGATILLGTRVDQVVPGDARWRAELQGGRVLHPRIVVDTTAGLATNAPVANDRRETWHVAIAPNTDTADPAAEFRVPFAQGLVALGSRAGALRPGIWNSGPVSVRPAAARALTLGTAPLPLIRLGPAAAWDARRLAELAVAEMAPFVTMIGKRWTRTAMLPGGDFNDRVVAALKADLNARHPDLPKAQCDRLFAAYGTEAAQILDAPPGHDFGNGVTEAEISYLRRREWARSAADVLWRRSVLGLWADADQTRAIDRFLAA